jgi:hypothetical protein
MADDERHCAWAVEAKRRRISGRRGTHTQARARAHARTHEWMHARMHACTHAHANTHTHAHTTARTHTRTRARAHAAATGCRVPLRMPTTSTGALSASSIISTRPSRTARTSGESSQLTTPSTCGFVLPGPRLVLWDAASPRHTHRPAALLAALLRRTSVGVSVSCCTVVSRCSWMYSRSHPSSCAATKAHGGGSSGGSGGSGIALRRLRACSSLSASLFFPVPWFPISRMCRSPSTRSCERCVCPRPLPRCVCARAGVCVCRGQMGRRTGWQSPS